MLTSLLLIMALLSGSVGTTYAAQSALPGDTLYPVKIASEKAQSAVTINDVKETELHGKFAERRLKEIAELNAQKTVTPELVKEAVDGYKAEISESRGVMQSAIRSANVADAAEITKLISEFSHRDRLELSRLSREIHDEASDNYLREAWNEATAHEDLAILAMLASFTSNNSTTTSATSTPSTATSTTPIITQATSTPIINYELQARVANKISEAAHKIGEAENYITLKTSVGVDSTQANAAITLAKTTLAEATTLATAGNYQEAFVKAKLAHELAENAKDLVKSHSKDKERDDDNFYVAQYLEQMNASATSTVSAPAPIIWQDLDESRGNDHKEKGDRNENKNGHDREEND
jgi:hypothetical protein